MPEWKTVSYRGYNLLVSDAGDIHKPETRTTYTTRRADREQTFVSVFKEKPLRPYLTRMGYLEVNFVHGRKCIKAQVHRLVAMAFVPGWHGGPEQVVNHLNGVKTDNRPVNLEWTTKGDNTRHAWATGLVNLRGRNQPNAKLTERQVREMRRLMAKGVSANSLSIVAGVSSSLLLLIRDGKRWPGVS